MLFRMLLLSVTLYNIVLRCLVIQYSVKYYTSLYNPQMKIKIQTLNLAKSLDPSNKQTDYMLQRYASISRYNW